MKVLQCQCKRRIKIRAGISGHIIWPFPKEVYLCPCGRAYIPQKMGCLVSDIKNIEGTEDFGKPTVLSPAEYINWKNKQEDSAEQCKKIAEKIGRDYENVIYEIQAEVIEEIQPSLLTRFITKIALLFKE